MLKILILLAAALLCSCIGFKKYIWFISIGYGFAVAGIGIALIAVFAGSLDIGTGLEAAMFILYGCRLGGFLAFREFRVKSYNKNMQGEVSDGSNMKFFVKIILWVSCAFLYVCECSPLFFRLLNGKASDAATYIGIGIMVLGLALESAADLQKNRLKKKNPNRFCDTGLFRLVRCPNYFGEMLFWTGTFVTGVTALTNAVQWIFALLGFIGIIYIMFSGARRLEIRQNKRYGKDKEYQKYVKKTPILVPILPIYSVEKYKWLVG